MILAGLAAAVVIDSGLLAPLGPGMMNKA